MKLLINSYIKKNQTMISNIDYKKMNKKAHNQQLNKKNDHKNGRKQKINGKTVEVITCFSRK